MVFPKIDMDSLVQENDMFRICAVGSFSSPDEEITEVRITPDTSSAAVVFSITGDCPEDWYLDWAYETAGDYTVQVEIVGSLTSKVRTQTITVITEEQDNLQADDACIYSYESELKKYLPDGRNSWKYIHRKALEEILEYLYRSCHLNQDGSRITKDQLITIDVRKWATFEAILLIFQDIKTSNSVAFAEKIDEYKTKRGEARETYINIDSDRDGNITDEDQIKETRITYFTR